MIIIMVGIVTRRVRMDMTIIIRIFNRMFMMVSILNRIIIDIKWMAIRMSIIMVRISYHYVHLESQEIL